MAASYSDVGSIASNTNFQARVDYAMMTAAIAACAEVNTTPSHTLRVTYAQKVLLGTYSVQRAAVAILTNLTLLGEANLITPTFGIPDLDLQVSANSNFNALAGVAT